MKRLNQPHRYVSSRSRRGSAMLLCFLAIAVVSVASIAMARSHRRLNVRRSVMQSTTQGRLVADGLVNREIAYQRLVAGVGVAPADRSLRKLPGFEQAAINLTAIDPTAQTIGVDVMLYSGAPSIRRTGVSYAENAGK